MTSFQSGWVEKIPLYLSTFYFVVTVLREAKIP